MHRFYLAPRHWNPDEPVLTGDEARHCIEVLRHREGETLEIFNGEGLSALTTIQSLGKHEVRLHPVPQTAIRSTPRPRPELILGQAIPKGKNMELIIQKATELGALHIHPLLTERTVVHLCPEERQRKQVKWQRIATEACKQSGQNWLPQVHPPQDFAPFLQHHSPAFPLIASLREHSRPLKRILETWLDQGQTLPASATILVGPEGGFTPGELDLAENHRYLPLDLGPIILRSETAAMHSLSIVGHELRG